MNSNRRRRRLNCGQGFFSFRLIDSQFTENDVTVSPKSCTGEDISFVITFPHIPVGTTFAYEWAWGFPYLYPVSREDLEPGKRKQDRGYVVSSLPRMLGDYKDFVFVLRFEGRPRFFERPIIRAYDYYRADVAKDD